MPGRALRIARTVFLWLFTALVALVMFLAGTGKMAGVNPWPEFFVAWGYPVWFRFFVGTLQLAGAITVLIPRVAGIGAAWLWIVMLGAVITELTQDVGFGVRTPIILLTMLSVLLWLRRGTLLAVVQRLTSGSHAEVARA